MSCPEAPGIVLPRHISTVSKLPLVLCVACKCPRAVCVMGLKDRNATGSSRPLGPPQHGDERGPTSTPLEWYLAPPDNSHAGLWAPLGWHNGGLAAFLAARSNVPEPSTDTRSHWGAQGRDEGGAWRWRLEISVVLEGLGSKHFGGKTSL